MHVRNRVLVAALALAGATLAGGCAQQVGDIDRTQPNKIEKTAFEGEWYMMQTVVGVNATAVSTFTGLQGDVERIEFDVREDYLVARRTYEDMFGSDTSNYGVVDGIEYDGGQPVAAFAIRSHFDIQRQYNATTGEQTNVIVENNFDRPWYERTHIRPDFSRNYVDTGLNPMMGTQSLSNVSFLPQNENLEDDDVTWFIERDEEGNVVYIDIVNEYVVEPDIIECILTMGLPWYGGACGPERIEVRTSFARIMEESDYQPRLYDDFEMNEFGFFRTNRCVMDRRYGCRDSGRVQMANIWSIWENDTDGNGNVLPYSQRTPDPIAYYVNTEFPADLYDEAFEIAEEWSTAFRRTVAAAQGVPIDQVPRMFYLCMNPGTTDPSVPTAVEEWVLDDELPMVQAAFAASAEGYENGQCVREGEVKNTGDVRYSFFNWVNNHPYAPWLGYGPSSGDPLTGELLSGNANINGSSVDTYAQYTVDLVRIMNGDLQILESDYQSEDPADFGAGAQIAAYFERRAQENGGIYYGYDRPSRAYQADIHEEDDKSLDFGDAPREVRPVGPVHRNLSHEPSQALVESIIAAREDIEYEHALAADVRERPHFQRIERAITSPSGRLSDNPELMNMFTRDSYYQSNPLSRIEGTSIEQRMITPEMEQGFGGPFIQLRDELGMEELDPLDFISPVRFNGPNSIHARMERRQSELLNRNIMMGADFDPYMAGFAEEMKAFYDMLTASGMSSDEAYDRVWREIRGRLFRGVQEHEVGHTIGLRHNFEASRDAMNFHPQYWALRQRTFEPDCDGSQGFETFDPDGLYSGDVAPSLCDGSESPEERAQRSAELYADLRNGVVDDNTQYGTMFQYMYSSIMDYDARPNTHWSGLGLYDYAAIAYGYAGLVEVFNDEPNMVQVDLDADDNSVYTRSSDRVSDMDNIEQWNTPDYFDDNGEDLIRDYGWDTYHYSILPLMFYDETSAVDTSNIASQYYVREHDASGVPEPFHDFSAVGPMARMYDRSLVPAEEVEAQGLVRVPYRFCSDEYNFTTNDCRIFDLGADDYEVLLNTINSYDSYYIVDFFRRERAGFGLYLWPLYSRMYSRYFRPAIQLYQYFLLDASLGSGWYGNSFGGLDRLLAFQDGVNFVANVITTPSIGAYVFDERYEQWRHYDDDLFDPADYSFDEDFPNFDGTSAINLSFADGARYGYSRFNRNTDEESAYYGWLQMEVVSHYFAKLAALEAITEGGVTVLGADSISDNSAFWIAPYSQFESEMNKFFGALIAEDYTDIGWCTYQEDGKLVTEPIEMIRLADDVDTCRQELGGQLLNPYRRGFGWDDFNMQLNSAVYAAAFFQAVLDKGWLDTSAVYFCGRGEQPDPGPGFHMIEYVDRNGICYSAIEPDDFDATDRSPENTWVGRNLINQMLDARYDFDIACAIEFSGEDTLEQNCLMDQATADDLIANMSSRYEPLDYFDSLFELEGLVEQVRFQIELGIVYNNY